MSGTRLHLMRHGVPERPNLLLGHRDDAPLPAGVALCADRAAALDFDQVVSSDLARAAVPAARIAASRDRPHAIDPRWRELDFGDWTGLAPGEVDARAHARFWNDPEAAPPPGGERWSQLCARVGAALARIDADTLVVTHGGAMRAALSTLFHMEHRHVWAFDFPCASVISLTVWPGQGAAQITGLTT